ncbi:glycosyltransferase family 2 protein [Methylorubrum extorquens]
MKYAAAHVHIKNEDDLILEWMAFHRAVGFEHLIITDNGSSDNSRSVIKKFRDAASVTYLHRRSGTPIDFEIDAIKNVWQPVSLDCFYRCR